MPSPQLRRLTEIHQLPLVDEHTLAALMSQPQCWLLLCAGHPDKYPEANDVAMVLPELLKRFPNLSGALVAAKAEPAFQQHFGFSRYPSLVLVREGQLLGVISEMQNWEDYCRQISTLLTQNTNRIHASSI